MQFGGWAGSCRATYIAANRVRKGQSLGLESFSSRVTLGGTSTDEVFFAQFQERLGFGFRDLKLFMGFQ
jgi:hypothetical protein